VPHQPQHSRPSPPPTQQQTGEMDVVERYLAGRQGEHAEALSECGQSLLAGVARGVRQLRHPFRRARLARP
jgi:hypothetical protein